jgi:subtilisin-like proprotein convertase family protein
MDSFMNIKLASIALALGLCSQADATTYVYNVNNLFATIPDGSLNGYQNSQNLAGLQGTISDVNLTLNVSGGFNGDFYAYLSHNNSAAVLLNRVGRSNSSGVGYGDAGFGLDGASASFTLDDQAAHDSHFYRTFAYSLNGNGQLTGQWQPDGRAIDPLSPGSAFAGAARSNMLGIFNGMDPNGSWTLFIADTSSGGEGTLVGWGLQIATVPEPANVTLLLCGFAGVFFRKNYLRHRIAQGSKVAR